MSSRLWSAHLKRRIEAHVICIHPHVLNYAAVKRSAIVTQAREHFSGVFIDKALDSVSKCAVLPTFMVNSSQRTKLVWTLQMLTGVLYVPPDTRVVGSQPRVMFTKHDQYQHHMTRKLNR